MGLRCVANVSTPSLLLVCVPRLQKNAVKDKQFNLLVSRVAGLGSLRHKPIGFTGPLSQHLLAYGSIINLVRQTLRDLIESAAVHTFMGAFANREVDITQITME
jgi:hypothetical protein